MQKDVTDTAGGPTQDRSQNQRCQLPDSLNAFKNLTRRLFSRFDIDKIKLLFAF